MVTHTGKKIIYVAIMVFMAELFIVMSLIWYTNSVAEESNRKAAQNVRNFCTLVVTLDETYSAHPPTTSTGKKIAAAMHQLSVDLGC